jgi:hypothetical protein
MSKLLVFVFVFLALSGQPKRKQCILGISSEIIPICTPATETPSPVTTLLKKEEQFRLVANHHRRHRRSLSWQHRPQHRGKQRG